MSYKLIDLNDDLRRLRDTGYNVDIVGAFLVVRDIPYVTERKEVRYDGVLVTDLTLNGDQTGVPGHHQMRFAGECPCNAQGEPLYAIRPDVAEYKISEDIVCGFDCSNKPASGYPTYYEKVRNYAALISGPASSIDPSATPMTFNVIEPKSDDSPFHYLDTNAAREINAATEKLAVANIAIVGLGGTGSYVLDLIAKTPVRHIHLFDGDKFSSHNAFRAPGAAPIDALRAQQLKVEYFTQIYSAMHRGIVAHPEYVEERNVAELTEMDAVFLCMDAGPGKRLIVDTLQETEVPFFDASIGLYNKNDVIGGIVQVTTSTIGNRDQARGRMSLADADQPNEYDKNIQVADLNALCAQLAVMRWKKMRGFYQNYDRSSFTSFTVGRSFLVNEDRYGED